MKISTQLSEVLKFKAKILNSIEVTMQKLKNELNKKDGELNDIFHDLKFSKMGYDFHEDTDELKSLNFIEQINRSYSDLVVCEAAIELLSEYHTKIDRVVLRFGVKKGTDVYSENRYAGVEVFSTINPSNNGKLRKDIKRIRDSEYNYTKRLVLYYSPIQPKKLDALKAEFPSVIIVPITRKRLLRTSINK